MPATEMPKVYLIVGDQGGEISDPEKEKEDVLKLDDKLKPIPKVSKEWLALEKAYKDTYEEKNKDKTKNEEKTKYNFTKPKTYEKDIKNTGRLTRPALDEWYETK